ncbi:cupin domain-containing protein [Corynebacterium halotolerans]|uniref:cupin domain-containing protein n=1 Tax=Corynebacterium halotolerans TaxID=225326 RepID=UPI003CF7ADB1
MTRPTHPAMTVLRALEDAPAPQPGKPRPAVTRLLQGDGANLIAFTFTPGQSLPDHRSAHPITVQCLAGSLDFGCNGETVQMSPGVVLHLPAQLTHRVDCPEDTEGEAVLLLMMLTGERPSN